MAFSSEKEMIIFILVHPAKSINNINLRLEKCRSKENMTLWQRAGLMAQSLWGNITQTIFHHKLSPAHKILIYSYLFWWNNWEFLLLIDNNNKPFFVLPPAAFWTCTQLMINFNVLYKSTKSRNRITAKNLYSLSSHPLCCKYPNIIPSFVHVFLILKFLICLFWDCTLISRQ